MCRCYNYRYYIALHQQTNCKEKDIALFVQNLFPKEKVDFVGDIRIRTHKNMVLRHNHSSPISTRFTLIDNIE